MQGVYKLKKGDVIRLEIEVPKELDLIFDVFSKITYINMKQYDKMINYLNDNTIKDVKYNSTGFIAKVEVEKEKKLLLLTIPYDENITIKLDDDLVEFEKYLNGIIGIEISEGTHLLTFNYSIKGLKMGILISLSFFIVFVCLKILEKIIIYRYNKNDNKEESLNERS